MSSLQFKRQRTGVLNTGYFNAVALPGIQAEEDGEEVQHPYNRTQIAFNGDASQLFYPKDFLNVSSDGTVTIRVKGVDDQTTVIEIGKIDIGLDGPTFTSPVVFSGSYPTKLEFQLSDTSEWSEANRTSILQLRNPGGDTHIRLATLIDGTEESAFLFRVNGDLEIPGTIIKGGGSFKIEHPLEEKKDTHKLVHSFVEAPLCDLYYSGMVDLGEGGKADIDIDDAFGMTSGTFEALTCNHRRLTTNETGFVPVRSVLDGSKLSIIAESDSCRDSVYWQVIGERCDKFIKSSSLTDESGRLITEPVIPSE